jgi:hypothetical protein
VTFASPCRHQSARPGPLSNLQGDPAHPYVHSNHHRTNYTPAIHEQVHSNQPVTQTTPNAAQRLRTTMAAVKLSFTWLGVRKTLAPEQRTTAARAFHADRELLTAG